MSNSAERQLTGGPRPELLDAAKLVENTAYAIATSRPSSLVSELIVIAAELDRLARLVGSDDYLPAPQAEYPSSGKLM